MDTATTLSRRDRLRAEAIAQIGAHAMAQVAAGGPPALSLTGIARQMGMTGPALYRYYASREELLARLVADVFSSLAGAMEDVLAETRPGSAEARLRLVLHAYRTWVLAHPREYVLLTAGVPGGEDRPEMKEATGRALEYLLEALGGLAGQARSPDPPDWLIAASVSAWQRVHGHLALEVEGLHAVLGVDSDALFEDELDAVVDAARRRAPDPFSRDA